MNSHIEDVEESVYSNIVLVSHHWPGITHETVWSMPYAMWLGYLSALKQLKENEIGWW